MSIKIPTHCHANSHCNLLRLGEHWLISLGGYMGGTFTF